MEPRSVDLGAVFFPPDQGDGVERGDAGWAESYL